MAHAVRKRLGELGLGTAVVGLVFGVFGYVLNPFVQTHWFPPDRSVSLSQVCLQSGFTLDGFVRRIDGRPSEAQEDGYSPRERSRPGLDVSVSLTAHGFDGHHFEVGGLALNATRGNAASGSLAGLSREVKGNADSIMRAPQFFVPIPRRPGTYVVRVDVSNKEMTFRLASKLGPRFSVKPGGSLKLSSLCTKT